MARGTVLVFTPAEVVARALSLCVVASDPDARIYYDNTPGHNGGGDPAANTCATLWRDKADAADDKRGRLWATADCVGFAMWAYGRDRRNADGTYWNQNSVWREASGPATRWRFCEPYPGCLALVRGPVPGDKRIGHMAVVTAVAGGVVTRVAHCSSGNKKRVGQAIAETDPALAFKRETFYVDGELAPP